MTLKEFLDNLSADPTYVIFYFAIIPIAALLAGILGKGEGHLSPWKYLYSALVYLVSIPGIFAVALGAYLFVFEKQTILNADIYSQILPFISMVITLFIISKNVNTEDIPGFGRLSVLITMIVAVLCLMWFIDRTRLIVFSYLPFQYLILIFVVLLLVIRFGFARLFR